MAVTSIAIYDFPISYDTVTTYTPRLKIARFGDGYEQRSTDGINNQPRMVDVKMDHWRELVQQAAAYLASTQGSTAFWFSPPFSTQGLFVCDQGFKVTERGYDYAYLEATFREVWELGSAPLSRDDPDAVLASSLVPLSPGPKPWMRSGTYYLKPRE